MTEATRQKVGRHLEKRKLESEIARQNQLIQKKYDKLLVAGGVVTLVIAVFSFILSRPFDYFFISIFLLSILAEFPFLFVKLNRKKKDLEEWRNMHHEF